ncbi:DUF4065 domain-containing protein [Cryobacterium sandaracinum]|uniref:DUF4065 domain-containing protein n=1 Tax=Cryobacterium sandaracinum TaxID=1259247 RepID=A0ABY2JFR1_9MICO|nr:type II toxin-antitoxin system antitoxin SocA domain-containing protein [Cryobacterium sandaracinum]TFD04824.1 DUF4065 domain-containing protein [Cryobacterium sandaracinum]
MNKRLGGEMSGTITVPAATVAAKFLELSNEDGVPVSNLKLQKLVCLTQSLSLFRLGRPAFREDVQAWVNGPVVKPLYGLYKKYGDGPIIVADRGRFSHQPVSSHLLDSIDEVWRIAGPLSAASLWTVTHSVGPWEAFFKPRVSNIVIPTQDIAVAWPQYKRKAKQLRGLRERALSLEDAYEMIVSNGTDANTDPADAPVIGSGQLGYRTAADYEYAMTTFTPTRARAKGA